jgi:ribose/xylose/arabinose/galactoside ABC-type transport system permease subunit
MATTKSFLATLYSAAIALWVAPALALAQAGGQPSPSPAPMRNEPAGQTSGSGWLWIVAALVVLAIIWWAMSSRRRRGAMTR